MDRTGNESYLFSFLDYVIELCTMRMKIHFVYHKGNMQMCDLESKII